MDTARRKRIDSQIAKRPHLDYSDVADYIVEERSSGHWRLLRQVPGDLVDFLGDDYPSKQDAINAAKQDALDDDYIIGDMFEGRWTVNH